MRRIGTPLDTRLLSGYVTERPASAMSRPKLAAFTVRATQE